MNTLKSCIMQFLKKFGKSLNNELRAQNIGFECNHVHLFYKSLVSFTSFALSQLLISYGRRNCVIKRNIKFKRRSQVNPLHSVCEGQHLHKCVCYFFIKSFDSSVLPELLNKRKAKLYGVSRKKADFMVFQVLKKS